MSTAIEHGVVVPKPSVKAVSFWISRDWCGLLWLCVTFECAYRWLLLLDRTLLLLLQIEKVVTTSNTLLKVKVSRHSPMVWCA